MVYAVYARARMSCNASGLYNKFVQILVISKSPTVRKARILSVEKSKTKRRRKKGRLYALTGFSVAIFHIKKNPRASITVRTPSAYRPLGNG